MKTLFIADFLDGFGWLALQMLGIIVLAVLATWLLCRAWYRKKATTEPATQSTAAVAAKAVATPAKPKAQKSAERDASQKLKADRDAARREVEALQAKLASATKDMVPASQLKAVEAQLAELTQNASSSDSNQNRLKSEFEALKREKQALDAKLQTLSRETVSTHQFNELQRKLTEHAQELETLRNESGAGAAKAKELTEQLHGVRQQLRDASNEANRLKKELSAKTAARDQMANRSAQADQKVIDAEEEARRLRQMLADKGRENRPTPVTVAPPVEPTPEPSSAASDAS
jgi:chromosome segregation ATPase